MANDAASSQKSAISALIHFVEPLSAKSVSTASHHTEAHWQQIERLVDDLAEMSKTDVARTIYHKQLLERLVHSLPIAGGAVWTANTDGQLTVEHQVGIAHLELEAHENHASAHLRLLQSILNAGRSVSVPPQSSSHDEKIGGNPSKLTLVVGVLTDETEPIGVMELFFAEGDQTSLIGQMALEVLHSVAELASDFYVKHRLRELSQHASEWQQFEQFAIAAHEQLDLKRTAYTIANEGRRFVECDRLSVFSRAWTGWKLSAVSGADTVDRRSSAMKLLEELVTAVLASDRKYTFHGSNDNLPPQIRGPLQAYLDESHVRSMTIVPLKSDGHAAKQDKEPGDEAVARATCGALVVEQFHATLPEDFDRRIDAAAWHAAIAIENSLEHESIPLARVQRQFVKLLRRGRLWKVAVALSVVTAIILALVFVQVEFTIHARGVLQPQQLRDVFAPSDGVVRELFVKHEQSVQEGTHLLVLRNPELELDWKRLQGELETARKRLAGIRAARIGSGASRPGGQSTGSLTADEEEAKSQIASLQRQLTLVTEQIDDLTVRSPITGQVLTWDLERLLRSRPIQRGQVLVSVADPTGPWELEIEIPDRRIGHVLSFKTQQNEPLPVSFILATDPNTTHRDMIKRISPGTELNEKDEPVVRATVGVPREQIGSPRPGATVTAKIHCGYRSAGFVWLHDLFELIQTKLLF